MTVSIIMSKDRIEQEHAMLNRLAVGLMDDGTQVVQVAPTSSNEDTPFEQSTSLAQRIYAPMPVSMLLRKARRDEVVQALDKANTTIIAAFGKQATQLALDVAPVLSVSVLSEVVSMKDANRTRTSSPIWRWFAATPTIERTIASRVGQERTALVPLGVAVHDTNNFNTQTSREFCITILDAAGDPKATQSILEALQDEHGVHLFLELTGRHQHRVWRTVKDLGMLERVTCLRNVGELRSLISQTSLIILPSHKMPIRTVFLEAMRCGVPIISPEITGFDMLVDEETALIVDGDWKEPIHRIIKNPDIGHRIGAAGSELVATHYGSATQIEAFEAAFSLI